MSNYSSFDYWNKRYEDEEDSPYDWLFAYSDVNEVIDFLLPNKNVDILMIGCGNAPFSPDMYNIGGYKKIMNTDLSDVVIKQQASKFPNQAWKVMDALNLEFKDNTFPAIIDKSLIDTLLCASQSKVKTVAMVKEAYRVLAPGGRFITFSLHSPEEVIPTYRDQGLAWQVTSFHIRSDRWNETDSRKRSVAHTMIVCDKTTDDGKYLYEHPLHIPKGVLAEDDYKRLKERADEVNLLHALQYAPQDFMLSALFHALHGESATRNAKLKALRELYEAADIPDEDNSDTPVFSEKEVLARVDHSLRNYLNDAQQDLHEALEEVAQVVRDRQAQ